jgi:hypothetical protein
MHTRGHRVRTPSGARMDAAGGTGADLADRIVYGESLNNSSWWSLGDSNP